MHEAMRKYLDLRLDDAVEALKGNGFEAEIAADAHAANMRVIKGIVPESRAKTVAFGGSMTVVGSGLYQALKETPGLEVMDTYDLTRPREEVVELRRQALLSDVFITGTNAVTEDGMLVNLDGVGNRVAALAFGPKKVVVLVGRNKLVSGLDDAFFRVKNLAAPVNAMRLNRATPCAKTSRCHDCNSEDRICSVWSILEKCFPKGRIHVILIDQEIGF